MKTDISAVLTVKSGSDPHMFNLKEITVFNSVVYLFQVTRLFEFTSFINVGWFIHA